MKQERFNNSKYEIWGENGWEDFDGVVKTISEEKIPLLYIETENKCFIECTPNHKLYNEFNNEIFAEHCSLNTTIQTINGLSKIVEINQLETNEVFDIINSDSHKVFTNGIKNHQCDEFAFVTPAAQAEEFWAANYPSLSSFHDSKIIIISTPNGLYNLFYNTYIKGRTTDEYKKLQKVLATGNQEKIDEYLEEEGNRNEFIVAKYDWSCVPGRDEEWARIQRSNMNEVKFNQEFGIEFIGSSNTLINSDTLKELMMCDINPIEITTNNRLRIYEMPKDDGTYIIGVDPSKGTGNDDSAAQIFRIDSLNPVKMEQVAVFQDNKTDRYEFASILNKLSIFYNNALMIIENNAEGSPVLHNLWYSIENTNIYCESQKKEGMGIRATPKTKTKAVTLMKKLLEKKFVLLHDGQTIRQLGTFIENANGSFGGQDGQHDDLISALYWALYCIELDVFDDDIDLTRYDEGDEEVYGILSDVSDEDREDWSWLTS